MTLNVILAGASGEVGKRLLDKLIANNLVSSIHIVNRGPHPIQHPKVIQHLVDFENLSTLDNTLKFDLAFCCLGTTIKKAGSKKAFEKVDFQYTCQFAQLAKQHDCHKFAVISCVGANAHKGGFYLETKGRMEKDLQDMNWQTLYLFRPSLLTGKRQEFRLGEQIGGLFSNLLSPLLQGALHKYRPIKMDLVANAMNAITRTSEIGMNTIEGKEILDLARQ